MAPIIYGFTYSFLIFVFVSAGDSRKGDLGKGAHGERGGLWFGPRLGKRSLQLSNDDSSDTIHKLIEAADALKFYYEQMPYEIQAEPLNKVSKKVIFTPKLGRALDQFTDRGFDGSSLDFTPRLGRKVGKELRAPAEEDTPEQVKDARANLFSPRLGRNQFHFSPRLGRELPDYNMYLEPEVRVARAASKQKYNN